MNGLNFWWSIEWYKALAPISYYSNSNAVLLWEEYGCWVGRIRVTANSTPLDQGVDYGFKTSSEGKIQDFKVVNTGAQQFSEPDFRF